MGAGGAAEPDIEVEYALDCRDRGQSHELTVPSIEEFHAEHERRNGYSRPEAPVEVVALRARARRPAPLEPEGLPLLERRRCEGPTVAIEPDCTVWIPEGWVAEPGALGAWILTRTGGDPDPIQSQKGAQSGAEPAVEEGEGASLDPAALRILIGRLTGVADEMGAVLRRAAFSPSIKERADCSAALFTPAGELLAQAEHIPVHLGSMPASVRAALDAFGDSVRPGDQVLLNDPYAGGTHLPDLTLVSTVADDAGGVLGYVANRAHHADVGGAAPGSMPASATDIAMEGLRIPPVLVGDASGLRADVLEMVAGNSRTPAERRGDLRAQLAANHVGARRLRELAARSPPQRLAAAMREVCDYSDRRVRTAVQTIPDGSWSFEDSLELDRPATIRATVSVVGDEVAVDFAGTDPQVPIN